MCNKNEYPCFFHIFILLSPLLITQYILTPIVVDPPYPFIITPTNEKEWNIITLKLPVGHSTTLFNNQSGPDFILEPLPGDPSFFNYWGYH